MAENYKLVREDEWQAMVDRAEVAEGWSDHWKWKADQAEGELALFLDGKADREEPVKIPGSDNPTRPRNGEKNWLWRYDVDGNLIWSGPPELAPAFGESETDTRDNAERFEYVTENGVRTPIERPRKVKWYERDEPRPLPPYMGPEPCDCEHLAEVREAGPQRPHESLVWAIYHAAAWAHADADESPIGVANALLNVWRKRWPESER